MYRPNLPFFFSSKADSTASKKDAESTVTPAPTSDATPPSQTPPEKSSLSDSSSIQDPVFWFLNP